MTDFTDLKPLVDLYISKHGHTFNAIRLLSTPDPVKAYSLLKESLEKSGKPLSDKDFGFRDVPDSTLI